MGDPDEIIPSLDTTSTSSPEILALPDGASLLVVIPTEPGVIPFSSGLVSTLEEIFSLRVALFHVLERKISQVEIDVARIIAASTISPVVVSNIVNPSTAAPASARRPSIPATPKSGIIRTSIARSINHIIIRVIISDILFRFNYIFNSNSGSSGCY